MITLRNIVATITTSLVLIPSCVSPPEPATRTETPVGDEDTSLDPKRCGDFALDDLESFCESLQGDCDDECQALQAEVGAAAFQPTGQEEIGLFCGSYFLSWFEPAELVHEGCFPRPTCFATDVRREADVYAGQPGWVMERYVWWTEGEGICREFGQVGSPTVPERFILQNGTLSYLEIDGHGAIFPRTVRQIQLAEYFAALGVEL
jgi:hypothetical protein